MVSHFDPTVNFVRTRTRSSRSWTIYCSTGTGSRITISCATIPSGGPLKAQLHP
jgi:hypothetical protein